MPRQPPSRRLRLGAEWIYQPTVNYYLSRHGIDWLEPMTRREFEGSYDFYFYDRSERKERLSGLSLTVLKEYPFTGRALAFHRPRSE